jgi:AcrR family transcriptional regulator
MRAHASAGQMSGSYHRRVTVAATDTDGGAEARPTVRTSKRRALRAKVERVALDLFRQHGFEQVTVERISAEAGVAPTTFYRYFGTKDAVVFDYQARWLQDVRRAVDELDVERPRAEQIKDLLSVAVRNFESELEITQLRDEIVAGNPTLLPTTLSVQRAWEQELAQSLANRRRLPAGDFTAQTDAALVQMVIRLAFRRWRAGASPGLTEAVFVAVHDLVTLSSDCSSAGGSASPDASPGGRSA